MRTRQTTFGALPISAQGVLWSADGRMTALSLLSRPPLWRESRVGLELATLLRDPVFRGDGVKDGRGQPVLLIPGFLAGDDSLALMTRWLREHEPLREAGRHPHERRLLRGRGPAPRGEGRGARGAPGPARGDHRPEPGRPLRARPRQAPPGPRRGHRHAGVPADGAARDPSARAGAGLCGRRARDRRRAGPVPPLVPVGGLLQRLLGRRRGAIPQGGPLPVGLLAQRRRRAVAGRASTRTPSTSRSAQATSAWACTRARGARLRPSWSGCASRRARRQAAVKARRRQAATRRARIRRAA